MGGELAVCKSSAMPLADGQENTPWSVLFTTETTVSNLSLASLEMYQREFWPITTLHVSSCHENTCE